MNRRHFLRAAGGVTFLALSQAVGRTFAAPTPHSGPALPLFTVLPYLQPGPEGRLRQRQQSMILTWQTHVKGADFEVDFGPTSNFGRTINASSVARQSGRGGDVEDRLNWQIEMTNLDLGREYRYRVRGARQVLAEGHFTTRQPRGTRVRFVAFGDNSYGDLSDRAIASIAYAQNPDFVMNCGDNVYDSGLDNEYQRFFFPVYNADHAGPRIGAPLLRSVPFYTVLGNHDVQDKDERNHEVADFTRNPDALGIYTSMFMPLNGPTDATYRTPIRGPQERLDAFLQAAGDRFPRMANYSYDYGDVHFLCLDSNLYIDPNDAALQEWMARDLSSSDATWKFVVFHHPPFNVGGEHFVVQHMRVLAPLFEANGVDFVLSGHEHNYQRARPLRFTPAGPGASADVAGRTRLVPGTFAVDRRFDGVTETRPDGILYVVTGAGGKHLYDPGYTNNPSLWTHAEDGHADYVVKMVTDRHSLTVFDVEGTRLLMRQIDESGVEIDRIMVSKR